MTLAELCARAERTRVLRAVTESIIDEMQKGWWDGPHKARVLRTDRPSAWDVNNGFCGDWADEAERRLGGEAVDLSALKTKKFGLPRGVFDDVAHVVLLLDGRFYDAQDIEGVDDPRQLQLVRGVSRQAFVRGSVNVLTPAGFDRTAMARTEPSVPVRHLQTHAPTLLRGRLLDFGSGQGVDAKALGATAYDPHHPKIAVRAPPNGRFDTVLCLYVLNVLPPVERAQALRDAAAFVKPGGTLVLAVRPTAEVAATTRGWARHADGHQVMGPDGTRDRFQRGFTSAQLQRFASIVLGPTFAPLPLPPLSSSVLLVLRRTR